MTNIKTNLTTKELSKQYGGMFLLTAYVQNTVACDDYTAEQIMLHIMDGLDRMIVDCLGTMNEE